MPDISKLKLATNAQVIKEVTRLQKYFLELQMSDRACVFSELSGHIDQIHIRICPDKKNYMTHLYELDLEIPPLKLDYEWRVYLRQRNWKEYVDEIIEDIEFALTKREEKIAEAAKKSEEAERARYEALKQKYEGDAA